jgi:hypothetical protein
MKIRSLAATVVLASGMAAGMAAPAFASTTACVTTNSHNVSVTAKGTRTETWTQERKCGKNYVETQHMISYSYTGSHYIEDVVKTETYPHYVRREVKRSWSKAGTYSVKVTVTSK